jgi:serine/threonine-protein kinase
VLELGQVEGRYFMAMEYVAGLTVAKLGKKATQRLGQVPQDVACGIVAQSCAGLHHAHERTLPDGTPLGIIHRDVSPQNLILSFEGNVKVVDFGIAKASGRIAHTRTGLIKGKSAYMSPEQCLTEPLDRRSDVFALGIVLWELTTSRRLFKRPTQGATFDAITKESIPLPASLNPKVHPAIEAVVMRALARHKDERFASAADLLDALEKAMTKAELNGNPSHLQRFLDEHFKDEREDQQKLLAQARKGDMSRTDPSLIAIPDTVTDDADEPAGQDDDVPATLVDPDFGKGMTNPGKGPVVADPALPTATTTTALPSPPPPPEEDLPSDPVVPIMSPPEHWGDSDTGRKTMVRSEQKTVIRPERPDDTQRKVPIESRDTGPSQIIPGNVPPVYWLVAGLVALLVIVLVVWAIL